MTMILSAATTTNNSSKRQAFVNQIASEVASIAEVMPGRTPREKHFNAVRVMDRILKTRNEDIHKKYKNSKYQESILKIAEAIVDNPSKSYTHGPGTSFPESQGKGPYNVPPQKQSLPEDMSECLDRVQKVYGLDSDAAKRVCDVSTRGYTTDEAGTVGGTKVLSHGKGGGVSVVRTSIPPKGELKNNNWRKATDQTTTKTRSASTNEIPSWITPHSGINPANLPDPESGLRSASKEDFSNYMSAISGGAVQALKSLQDSREVLQEQRNIRNASLTEDKKPAWLVCWENRSV